MKNLTTKMTLAAAMTLAMATFGAPAAQAQEAAPEHAVTFNAALSSDYRYRGLSQSRFQPALSAGADYTHSPTGFYVGTWASTIKWIDDVGGDAKIEIDVYGGKRGEIAPGFTYDVGGLYYVYPDAGLAVSPNTFELYGQLNYSIAYVKYSHSTTNLFGTANSKGSGYLDVGANVELSPGLVLNLHAGRQRVANNGIYSYNDFKIGLTKDLGFASLSGALIKAQTDDYISPKNGKNLGKTGFVVSLSKTF